MIFLMFDLKSFDTSKTKFEITVIYKDNSP